LRREKVQGGQERVGMLRGPKAREKKQGEAMGYRETERLSHARESHDDGIKKEN